MKQSRAAAQEAAEALAVQALTFIAEDAERLGRFLAVTGIGPAEIRAASNEPGFLGGVLDYLASDERLLLEFAATAEADPATVDKARLVLGGSPWERDVP
ncbi:MAG TPA: DUF3572 domain-containing protein [Pseudolabrys sp.]|jgi:hypothetical protein|nr:DUF3572 domain-containing protein [Pseudolabrys sp.]